MSDPSVIAAAMVTVIAATSGAIVTVVNAVAAAKDRRAGRESRVSLEQTTHAVDRKADTLITKAEEIHSVTNGNLSKVQTQLEVAVQQLDAAHQTIRALTLKIDVLEAQIADPAAVHGHTRRTDPQPT